MGSMNVPQDNSKLPQEEKNENWKKVMSEKLETFEEYYTQLQQMFPGKSFDFFTDGDPPDKEDDWKVFAALVSSKPGNTLTITRKDEDKKDESKLQERIQQWRDKNVKFVNLALTLRKPLEYTLEKTDVVVTMNIVPESIVFDRTEKEPMLDGHQFKQFQIKSNEWTCPEKNSFRPIQYPQNGLPDTELMTREEMQEFLKEKGVDTVIVKSQAKIEVDRDLNGYEKMHIDNAFQIWLKPFWWKPQRSAIHTTMAMSTDPS